MKVINTDHLLNKINDFVSERDWDQFHSVKNLSMALSVEVSELVEIFQWLKEEDSNNTSSSPELKGKVSEELADIFYYLLKLSQKCDVDLEEALLNKLEKNNEKYPVNKAKGNSKKYSDL